MVADTRAFRMRYPNVPLHRIVGPFRGHLDNGGEKIVIQAADDTEIAALRYEDAAPWPVEADGSGRSLVLAAFETNPDPNKPANWRASLKSQGSPLAPDNPLLFAGDSSADSDGDGLTDLFEFAAGSDPMDPTSAHLPSAAIASFAVNGVTKDYVALTFRRRAEVQGVAIQIDSSRDLQSWTGSAPEWVSTGSSDNGDGTVTETYRSAAALSDAGPASLFLRVSVKLE